MKNLLVRIYSLVFYMAFTGGVIQAQSFPDVVYVTADGTGDGSSWANAMGDIQSGVNAANSGGLVWVSNGTFTLTAQITLADGITVRGLYGTNNPALATIVDGGNSVRCFLVNHGVLDSLVIRNGRAAYAAGINLIGGTAMHCRVEGNIATNSGLNPGGGAMRLNGVCVVSNCSIIRNQIQYNAEGVNQYGGSALHIYKADYLVTDCVIAENVNNLQIPTVVGTIVVRDGAGDLLNCDVMWNTNYASVNKVILTDSLSGTASFRNCFVVSNDFSASDLGNALYLVADATAGNCTIADNVNSRGVWMEGNAALLDSTVRGHENVTLDGAGICMNAASACLIDNCIIESNSIAATASNRRGAGVFLRGGTIKNSTIRGNENRAARGGGVMIRGAPSIISNCWIVENKVFNGGSGAGVGVWEDVTSPNTLITHSMIQGNEAEGVGGGISTDGYSSLVLRNSLIARNTAALHGGGVCAGNISVESCSIVSNRVTHPNYRGGGLYLSDENSRVVNTIIYGNMASLANSSNWYNFISGATYSNCCTMPTNALPGAGNIKADPLFVDCTSGNYRLQRSSPCIDAGINQMAWMPGALDLDGRARIDRFSGIVDIGCYEHVQKGTMIQVR